MKKHLLFIQFVFLCSFCFAQRRSIDSLLKELKNAKRDTSEVKTLLILATNFGQTGSFDTCFIYSRQALDLSERLSYKTGRASALTNIGIVYKEKANYPLSLEYNFKALKVREEIGDKRNIAASLNNLATVFKELKEYKKALEYNSQSLDIKREIKDSFGIAASLNNIAVIYRIQNDEEKALEYNLEALKIREKIKDLRGIAVSMNNIGNSLSKRKKYPEALEYITRSLKIREKINDNSGIAMALRGIAEVYEKQNKLKEAETFGLRSLALAKAKGLIYEQKEAEKVLSVIYDRLHNYTAALKHYETYISIRDSIFNEENTKQAVRQGMNFEFEKKEVLHKLDAERKQAVSLAESKKQKAIIWSACGILLLAVCFALFVYRSYLQKDKANVEILLQKQIIEEKQREILDSIRYAKRIQTTLLPSEKYIDAHLKRHSGLKYQT